jgi:hypothetical protein
LAHHGVFGFVDTFLIDHHKPGMSFNEGGRIFLKLKDGNQAPGLAFPVRKRKLEEAGGKYVVAYSLNDVITKV